MVEQVKVWDRFVRVFHWALVAFFVTSYLTAEENTTIHSWSGYTIFTLVSLRVIWGIIGSRYARFSQFVYSPKKVVAYIKEMPGKPKRYLGHNPAGGMMIVAMLVMLFLTTLSGMKLYAVEDGKGPIAALTGQEPVAEADAKKDHDHEKEGEELWEEIHETAVNTMLFLIALHITGVVFSSRKHHENLARSMVTGDKERREGDIG